jgi:hypothetical protein
MNNINVIRKPSSREGEANPMYGKRHSDETKRKQSEAAKKRYSEINKLKQVHYTTMDELLANNPSVKESINRIIKEEIDKYLWQKQH